MSAILRAPTAFLNLVASALYNANLRLVYSTGPSAPQLNPVSPVATGATAAGFINTGAQTITGPAQLSPSPALALNQRSWTLTIPSSQQTGVLGVQRDINLGEFCETVAEEPGWLLALGFTPYTPVSAVPIPMTC